jgi:hypothetical protein
MYWLAVAVDAVFLKIQLVTLKFVGSVGSSPTNLIDEVLAPLLVEQVNTQLLKTIFLPVMVNIRLEPVISKCTYSKMILLPVIVMFELTVYLYKVDVETVVLEFQLDPKRSLID